MRPARGAAVLAMAALLSGCVAAAGAAPWVAGLAIGQRELRKQKRAQRAQAEPAPRAAAPRAVSLLPAGSVLPPPDRVAPGTGVAAGAGVAVGAGETAALSIQAYMALRNHVSASARLRKLDVEPDGVILAEGATLADPKFYACQGKPIALLFDVDGSVLDRAEAPPGAVAAVEAAREAGVAVLFSADRPAADANEVRAALARAGLSDANPGETLWLRRDAEPAGEDARRFEIAKRWCVVAQVGDALGDFSDLLDGPAADARREAAVSPQIAALWGAGWFLIPAGEARPAPAVLTPTEKK